MRVLVLGGYGLIGTGVSHRLVQCGHAITIAGRDAGSAARAFPDLPFVHVDLTALGKPEDWLAVLDRYDVVVNCAGALQDGGGDDLEAVHNHAIAALGQAARALGVRIIQISAVGATTEAPTRFMASKGRGDAALLASGASVTILRPGLVLAQGAYGGTLLLRMLSAVPWVQPIALPDAPIQTVALNDVADAVAYCIETPPISGSVFDLVEDTPHSLERVVAAHREALGLAPAKHRMVLPETLLPFVTGMADALGRLGWRSPLRRTAVEVLRQGVKGDAGPWRRNKAQLSSMSETLADLRFGPEHRLQARAALLMPICVATLSIFWALSGLFGLFNLPDAAANLTDIGWPEAFARRVVQFWSLVDLALAALILWRPWAQRACLGMIGVSLFYLVSASFLTPALWADPLGPLVKVLPSMTLALVTHFLLERR